MYYFSCKLVWAGCSHQALLLQLSLPLCSLSHLVSDAADLEAYLLKEPWPLAVGEVDSLLLLPFLHPAGLHSGQLSIATSGWLHQLAVLVLQSGGRLGSHIHLHTNSRFPEIKRGAILGHFLYRDRVAPSWSPDGEVNWHRTHSFAVYLQEWWWSAKRWRFF